jgi:hypothetical protein
MAKIFKTCEDITNLIEEQFNETGLSGYGVSLKIMSVTKSKDIIKLTKASATTEYLVKKDGLVQIFVFEEAFERLPIEAQKMLVEMVLSNVAYDTEKDKLMVDTNPYNMLFRLRKKYGEAIMNNLELASIVMTEIEEEEKARKEAEREAKKAKKNN